MFTNITLKRRIFKEYKELKYIYQINKALLRVLQTLKKG